MKKVLLTMFLIALFLTAIPTITSAQPEIEWQQNYGGEDEDRFLDIIQTDDGGYIMTGIETSFGEEDPDTWIVKTDEEGEIEWTLGIDGYFLGIFHYILQANDGGFILCTHNATMMKIDVEGEIIWERNFNHTVESIIQDVDGGYSLAGFDGSDFFITKIDEDGDEIWTSQFGGDQTDYCYSHTQTQDDGYILVGSTDSFDAVRGDGLVVKMDADGEVEWHQTFGGRRRDYFLDVLANENGSFTIVGYNRSLGDGSPVWLLNVDEDGERVWERGMVNVQAMHTCWILPAGDGGFTLIGEYAYPGIYRASADGEELWSLRLNDLRSNGDLRAILTQDGGYGFGYTNRDNRGDYVLVKLSADPQIGVPGWQPFQEIELDENNEYEMEMAFIFEHIIDVNDPDSTLEISIEEGENIFVDIDDDFITIIPKDHWWGTDNIRLIVTDPDDHSADTNLQINVSPVNDPPLPFALSLPENGWEVNARRIAFHWEEAEQNEYEIDSVNYILTFASEDEVFELTEIENVMFVLDDIDLILDRLGITDSEVDIEISWSVTAIDDENETVCVEPFVMVIPALGIGLPNDGQIPMAFSLSPAFPNPFNAVTKISFGLAESGYASLTILDLTGHEVATLINGQIGAGRYTAVWNADQQPAGLYFYQLQAGSFQQTRKLMLIK